MGGCSPETSGPAALACVVNISEGRDRRVIGAIVGVGGGVVLDVHSDPDHHRTVLTMAGENLEEAVRAVARRTVEMIDLRGHSGVHPRLGALDVVPFTPLDAEGSPVMGDGDLTGAIAARDRFATWAGDDARPSLLPLRSGSDVTRRAQAGVRRPRSRHRSGRRPSDGGGVRGGRPPGAGRLQPVVVDR